MVVFIVRSVETVVSTSSIVINVKHAWHFWRILAEINESDHVRRTTTKPIHYICIAKKATFYTCSLALDECEIFSVHLN